MCGITGWINYYDDISDNVGIIKKMTDTLSKRGPNDEGYFISKNALLGHRRLIVVDPEGGAQPMIKEINNNRYVIVYNGELYNTEELRKELFNKGYTFNSYSDTEVLLTSYICWGTDCLKHVNGIFAFAVWDEGNKKLFMARDHLGVKPLFYCKLNNSFIFSSEIKAILAYPKVEPILDRDGIREIFSLGPARSLGSAVFKNIYEVPPAHYVIYDKDDFLLKEYWCPKCLIHNEDVTETAEHLKYLLNDIVKRQLIADVPVCTFLSGGLDSSGISAISSNEFKNKGKILDTYQVDYEDYDKYFSSNSFEPTSDKEWALKMSNNIGSNHKVIVNNVKDLASSLLDSVKANDLPGMADIDSSLYLFCKQVRKNAVVALSGECADEIFGGYPWYTNTKYIYSNKFPWYHSTKERKALLNGSLINMDIEGYMNEEYKNTIKKVPHIDGESKLEYKLRELFYLNIKWFMLTLLNRKDRMSMANSLEVRVPFADYRLVEYAFNIPAEIKFLGNREKGILRKAFEGILPSEIINRKKSPYPKVHNPHYTRILQKWLKDIIDKKTSPILEIVNRETVSRLIETGGEYFNSPWFGQLMRGPQLIAYLIQINFWLEDYNINIEI